MMPIYGRMMDSSPHQSEYQQTFPIHQIPLNPSNPPMFYQPWPHSGNYAYPYPMPFNSCCNHGNFSGFHSHIPSYPQPQPLPYCPSQPYSACYFPPPPRYSTETSGSLIPVSVKGYPYPVAWVPQEYVKPLDSCKLDHTADHGDEANVRDQKVAKEKDESPIPFGKEEVGKMKGDVNESGDREKQFQFPIIWMPGRDTNVRAFEDKNEKEASAPLKSINELPFLFKFLPVETLGVDKDPGNSNTNEESAKKEETEAKKEERAVTRKNVPVKTELAPVCLRVDPLPKKKKNENVGSRSRSPSPPKQKTPIDKTLSNNEEQKESVVVMEKVSDRPQVSVDSLEPAAGRKEVGKKQLSDVEAALRIQSAYRGYEIRRSQPLKKLKQISEVREQVADVQNSLRALESSSDVPKDDKRRLIVGETIMRLLLQLDTIQGLLPSLRDIRKTLAKELVSLQEKLDSLVMKPEKQESGTRGSVPVDVDVLGVVAGEVECKEEKSEESFVNESDEPKLETCVSGPVDLLSVEGKQDEPEEIHVVESEKPKSETFFSGPVNVLSVETEEIECNQEEPKEIHVIESEKLKSEICTSGSGDLVSVETEEVECKQEKPEEIRVIESEKPKSDTFSSGSVTVEDEYKQAESEEILVIETEKPESETCDSGQVNVLGVEAEDIESRQEKPQEETERDRSCDDVPMRSFHVIESRQALDSESTFEHSENVVSDGGSSDAVATPCDFETELADTKQVDTNLESERADEAQLKQDSEENPDAETGNGGGAQSVMASREAEEYQSIKELDDEANEDGNPKDKDSIEVKKLEQALEAIENERLREMMEKLLEAGEKQLNAISGLSARVKDMEKKLYSRNKLRTKTNRRRRSVVKQ